MRHRELLGKALDTFVLALWVGVSALSPTRDGVGTLGE